MNLGRLLCCKELGLLHRFLHFTLCHLEAYRHHIASQDTTPLHTTRHWHTCPASASSTLMQLVDETMIKPCYHVWIRTEAACCSRSSLETTSSRLFIIAFISIKRCNDGRWSGWRRSTSRRRGNFRLNCLLVMVIVPAHAKVQST